MSLLSIKRKTIHLSPGGIAGLARSRLNRERVEKAHACDLPASEDGKLDLSGLAETVRQLGGGDIELVLGDHFVQYTLFPWQEGLHNRDEEIAFARHAFTRLWGNEANQWRVALSDEAPGQTKVAAAIDAHLIDGLADTVISGGGRLVSVKPALFAALDYWRDEIDDALPQWFLLHDAGLLAIALLEKGAWRWVRTRRVGPEWAAQWRDIVAEETLMLGEEVVGASAWLCAPGSKLPKDHSADGVDCHALGLDAALGLLGLEDRRLQLAWMA